MLTTIEVDILGMLPPGHIAAGFLSAKIASNFIPALGEPQYLGLTAFFGFFPDLDFFLAFFKLKKFISSNDVNHRRFATHAPLLYLFLFTVYYLLFPDDRIFAWAFIIGTWSHFLIDSFSAEGVQWLYPFSKKLYGLPLDARISVKEQGFMAHWVEFVKVYSRVFSFKAEILLIIIALSNIIYEITK